MSWFVVIVVLIIVIFMFPRKGPNGEWMSAVSNEYVAIKDGEMLFSGDYDKKPSRAKIRCLSSLCMVKFDDHPVHGNDRMFVTLGDDSLASGIQSNGFNLIRMYTE